MIVKGMGILVAAIALASPVQAEELANQPATQPATQPAIQPIVVNPFLEGVETPKWSDEEVKIYKTFTERAVARLQRALDDAKGKTFEEANRIYLSAIKTVVAKSFEDRARTELLLRYSLNAALDLTYGVPNPDGNSVLRPGVLQNIANKELLTVILEDSIELAIQYAQHDIRAIETNEVLNLPYGKYAGDRLNRSRSWLAATFEWKAAYVLSVATLEHWATTIKTKENVHWPKYSEALERVREVLSSESRGQAFEDPRALVGRVRTLRKTLRQVAELGSERKASDNQTQQRDGRQQREANPGSGNSSGDAVGSDNLAEAIRIAALANSAEVKKVLLKEWYTPRLRRITAEQARKLYNVLPNDGSDIEFMNRWTEAVLPNCTLSEMLSIVDMGGVRDKDLHIKRWVELHFGEINAAESKRIYEALSRGPDRQFMSLFIHQNLQNLTLDEFLVSVRLLEWDAKDKAISAYIKVNSVTDRGLELLAAQTESPELAEQIIRRVWNNKVGN